jgi:dTDP-4-amino-4,6-dideoxygalactose transaminase
MERIPFVDLKAQYQQIKKEVDSAIQSVISETAFIGGKHVDLFESRFASLLGARHVISCANGTDSLFIIMKMLGIGNGDEVITAANSWISSSETITQTGARPVFVDVHPDYFSMDEDLLESKITSKSKAVVAVHLQGQVCDIERIRNICDRHKLWLIEDCAQSHLSEFKGKVAGLFGHAASFSFYPGKNLGAYGDAGCVATNDTLLAERFRMYARHGALKKHEHKIEGINSRLDGLQAAILNVKMNWIKEWTDQRIQNAKFYNKYLQGIEAIQIPSVRPDTKHTFHLYVIKAKRRNELAEWLKSCGIETSVHYPTALPNLEAYKYLKLSPAAFPMATVLQDQILSLPMYPELKEDAIATVAGRIREFYN